MQALPPGRKADEYSQEGGIMAMNSELQKKEDRTASGYRPGPLKASDGTLYVVEDTGQIRRLERKMGKAERKRHKKERRLENLRHQERAAAEKDKAFIMDYIQAAVKKAGGDARPTGEGS
jgi:hypothetical protein